MSSNRMMTVIAALVAAIATLSCSSAGTPGAAHSTTPGVVQVGETMVRSVGADLEGIVGYKFAASNLGEEWLIIDLALTGLRSEAVEVRQSAVAVVTPDGRRIALPTQKEFIERFGEVQSAVRRAQIASQPLEATRGGRAPCDLDFLRIPGTGSTRDAIWINQRQLCVGMLAFPVPGGVQPGRWRLVVELEESSLDIPFDLGR